MSTVRTAATFAAGLVGGALLLGAARYVAMPPADVVHYHANWAVMIGGQQLDLSGDRYMEDVASCSADPSHVRPEDRVHLHENVADAVHVHAAGVTWGHLLANLGFGVGDDYLVTDRGVRYDGSPLGTIKFIVNGRQVPSIRNRPIVSGDRLLISFGAEPVDAVIRDQFPQVATTAERLNTLSDPASCSGHAEPTAAERWRAAFWF